ncbi:L-serine ammonia-lyase, iron-sulfur-dependent, subunit alpha [Geothrix sp. PMB-07]|uniref:L-serine ammonia-lyase, iron-sulfur-dependent, subunit alpha n=1 Tax=Geothrix sp. PMB-07 TaxID=3068640 RepID=UPI0027423094|nr:L-serine ammonia-lyase, iron-sulfur-dependent, subunit alpha [Geothrix sp. PMB-07]WLT30596.1 L-serine ammonia-lyase, iron-sulfur-dependent, subunit alpha [Geothrix sp. PMB-07]
MNLTEYLAAEWKPALGCTEPAAVALAACLAAGQGQGQDQGEPRMARLVVDARTYKNCHAVGIPNSGRKTGVLWALALGAVLKDAKLGLQIFELVTPESLAKAARLLERGAVHVEVDASRTELHIDCTVASEGGVGRAVMEREHTRLVRLEVDGVPVPLPATQAGPAAKTGIREQVGALSLVELVSLAGTLTEADRARLREGVALNLALAEHCIGLLPEGFVPGAEADPWLRIPRLVSAGVLGRMSGEAMTVMSLAGSGNKGITVAVAMSLWAQAQGAQGAQGGQRAGHSQARLEEALALACLLTSATTHRLGTLSAICGASNAAGIGIAAGLVHLGGGTPAQMDLAIHNMVGNLAGLICDGAKIGCAMKAMTGVEAAFRSATLALAGFGIPETDGIVGHSGESSLANLGRLAQHGMVGVDTEILDIMQAKLGPA